ncbi:hypothetical protein DFQ27_007397 [Actinomortierella ambigua]|uniref:LITAF domain-containing protein n=1 Tax=Actinomortierella ambigua TaxID=1343610 RepID=A0A9P6QIV6_9FUNG|nr:hypothetical protein DFQ27_007397 [Actinomortierella ambigua]
MDFDMLQQQRLQQAAAALIATAAAASSSSSPTSTRDHNSTTGGRRALTLTPTTTTTTTTTAADPWRDQWLGPSGAMQSLFRDRPSKFNCPHCGARRVRSHIEFVPGVMSFLVSFGLLFLTVGTLSFLPFRKDHKATKDYR